MSATIETTVWQDGKIIGSSVQYLDEPFTGPAVEDHEPSVEDRYSNPLDRLDWADVAGRDKRSIVQDLLTQYPIANDDEYQEAVACWIESGCLDCGDACCEWEAKYDLEDCR